MVISTETPKAPPPPPKEILSIMHSPKIHQDHDLRVFEDAISNIDIGMMHEEKPEPDYYEPKGVGEGYFSEIEHYLKNKDVNEIIDDILKKDFLTSMKDYHGSKDKGKPFFLHKEDLKSKLESKMANLRELEEKWHRLNKTIEETDSTRKQLEKQIDDASSHLKDLFRQVKSSNILDKQAPQGQYFKLGSGQELKSLNDLRKTLSYMKDEEFSKYVNDERNDFSLWAIGSLDLPQVGESIKLIKSKNELEKTLSNL